MKQVYQFTEIVAAQAGAAIAGRKMSLRIPLRSEKPGNVQISEKEFWRESCGKSSMSMNEDREWPEDDMDWSFKIQDEKQLEQCLQMKTDDIHWDIFKDAYECPGAIKVEVWSWETLMGERSFFMWKDH